MRAKEFITELDTRPSKITARLVPKKQEDLNLFEMVNFQSDETGIKGTIYISTKQASHGPRIKWYPAGSKSTSAACISVLILDNPQLINHGIPKHVVSRMKKPLIAWVEQNRQPLLDFWFKGKDMKKTDYVATLQAIKPL